MKRTVFLLVLAQSTNLYSEPLPVVMAVDLECPFTQRALIHTVPYLKKKYGDAIAFTIKQMPLEFHLFSEKGARGAICAEKQNSFEPFLKVFSTKPDELEKTAVRVAHVDRVFDISKFLKCTESFETVSQVKAEKAEMTAKGATGTPHFWVNGVKVTGNQKETLDALISAELNKSKLVR